MLYFIFSLIRKLIRLAIILFIIALILIKPGKKRDTSYFYNKMYAHRGLHDDVVPENSLTAFRLARENGYGVELDVQMTKDGQLVVFHDGNLKRVCGVDGFLRDYTYEELQQFSLKGTQEKIPLFSTVLNTLGTTDLICEIKGDNGNKNYVICQKTYEALLQYPGRYCVESFSPYLVKWFKDNQAKFDEIYDKLVRLRDTQGRKLGYDGYTPLGYYRMNRTSYTKEDVEKFREGVVKYIVPLCEKLCRAKAERLGFAYPMSFAENALGYREGNPKPTGSYEDTFEGVKKFLEELSPETNTFIHEMIDKDMFDLIAKEGKAGGGYTEDVSVLGMPYVFTNFNGSQDDVSVSYHELGHAFEDWINQDKFPKEYIYGSMESCEVHSMAMEFFGDKWADLFFGKDADRYKEMHLFEAITFIPYGTMVDHFQHIAYEKPDMTPRQRHDVWKELTKTYMPWLRLDGEIPFYADGESWQYKHHIYELPFYYIDYCLAQTVALQFWSMMQDDFEGAWNKYMKYTRLGGTKTFTQLLDAAGLESPFNPETIKAVCKKVENQLCR